MAGNMVSVTLGTDRTPARRRDLEAVESEKAAAAETDCGRVCFRFFFTFSCRVCRHQYSTISRAAPVSRIDTRVDPGLPLALNVMSKYSTPARTSPRRSSLWCESYRAARTHTDGYRCSKYRYERKLKNCSLVVKNVRVV
ncbi:hypothetical protein EVAR_83478_1 [Eumeta japonica]|uniref:Uncharacterized protein n=1 Tax=Eumeta variegata TaxID=151549 RepID=A0A4C1ZIZ1_EUMVA|nr:hypothetical protein EVAR_83478_1 [Eumeta japonica]